MHSPTLDSHSTYSPSYTTSTTFMKRHPSPESDQQPPAPLSPPSPIMAKQNPSAASPKNDSIRDQPEELRRKQRVQEEETEEMKADDRPVTGRERLKRHRVEVAGQVWIPDIWGQEKLLKDWIDCSAFDASVMNSSIVSARAALAEEGRRAHSATLRVEKSC